jgi:Sulfotransferase family
MTTARFDSRPFFIVGCGRSGSTLLQVLLDAHPDLCLPPETLIYSRFGGLAHYYGDLSVRGNRNRFIGDVIDDFYFRAWDIDLSVDEVEKAVTTPTRAGIVAALFGIYASRKGARRWGDKSPPHVHCLPLIREDFPRAQLIHLVRDGRDTAEAWRRMLFGPVDITSIAKMWRRDVAAWRAFFEEAGPEGMLEVRFEDLITAPQRVLEEILVFLGESVIDTRRMYVGSHLARSYSSISWHSSLKNTIDPGKIGVYRSRFSRREIELFEHIAGEALSACGYKLEFERPRGPGLRDHLRALVVDRCVRWYRKVFHPRVVLGDLRYKWLVLRRRLAALQT